MDETKQIEIIRKKAEFFKNQNLAVHISKKNNRFHNGIITSIESDFLILNDEKEGNLPIFFLEIFEIEKREEKKN